MSDSPEQTFTLSQIATALATATTPAASTATSQSAPPSPPPSPVQAAPSAPSADDIKALAEKLRPHLAPPPMHPAPASHNPLAVSDDPFRWNIDQLNHYARSQGVDREDRYSPKTRAFNRAIREKVMAYARRLEVVGPK